MDSSLAGLGQTHRGKTDASIETLRIQNISAGKRSNRIMAKYQIDSLRVSCHKKKKKTKITNVLIYDGKLLVL